MFVKLKEEGNYHFCRDHIEELGKLDELAAPDQLNEWTRDEPEDEKLCEKCQTLSEKGKCTPIYVEVGSHADET